MSRAPAERTALRSHVATLLGTYTPGVSAGADEIAKAISYTTPVTAAEVAGLLGELELAGRAEQVSRTPPRWVPVPARGQR